MGILNTYGIKHIYNRMNRFIVFHLSLIVWFCHTNANNYMHMIHINCIWFTLNEVNSNSDYSLYKNLTIQYTAYYKDFYYYQLLVNSNNWFSFNISHVFQLNVKVFFILLWEINNQAVSDTYQLLSMSNNDIFYW